MKIGILGAMREEITPILEKLTNIKETSIGGNTYYEAKYNNNDLVIAYSKIGKVHSAITASTLILHFGVEAVIFSGVAGSLDPMMKIGDLLLGIKLVQHDVDITAFGHKHGFIPEGELYYASSDNLNKIAKNVAMKNNIKLHEGIIASGDQFISNNDKKVFITETFSAKACEMEGASVAVVCANFNIPFCIIRSISDNADGSADISFDEFLQTSAIASANFVLEIANNLR